MRRLKNYAFAPSMAFTVCLALLTPLFLSLGFWQLRRADEKQALMDRREQRAKARCLRLDAAFPPLEDIRYRCAEVAGAYDAERQFLLDNQVSEGEAGYHVLTPLRLEGADAAVLVNRGWTPVGADRSKLPPLPIMHRDARVQGVIDKFPSVGFQLKGAEIPAPGWPSVVQLADAERLSERLGYRLAPYQLLLAPSQGEGYRREWRQTDFDPGKSKGYALQWFSFASALATLYLWHGFRPKGGAE
jgi:surfeit locus 1 family protein